MADKPLHVQVAEALGFHCVQHDDGLWWTEAGNTPVRVPRYDSDWSATGPLIERFKINLIGQHHSIEWPEDSSHACISDQECVEFNRHAKGRTDEGFNEPQGHAPTPLLAVCYLILELAKTGKL